MMKKIFLLSLLILFCGRLYSQNSSRTGIGNIALTVNKSTLVPAANNNIVMVTQQAVQFTNAQETGKNYPGYHATIINSNIAEKENQPVIEITAPASPDIKPSGEYHKTIKISENNASKKQSVVIDVSNKVIPLK